MFRAVTVATLVAVLQAAVVGVGVAWASVTGSEEPMGARVDAFIATSVRFAVGAALVLVPIFVALAWVVESNVRARK